MKKEALFYRKLKDKKVKCKLCAHNCIISDGSYGFCGVRKNIDGTLYTFNYGNVIAQHIDPIEKKPLYHFLPGSKTYSIALPGCNFKCGFCQNWQISQLRGEKIEKLSEKIETIEPSKIVEEAIISGCKSIAFTYTEPAVFFENMIDISKIALDRGVKCVVVSNGFFGEDSIKELCNYVDAFNIDLKAFSEDFYRKNCKASLKPVLDNLSYIKLKNKWLEITTLLIPGENDKKEELEGAASFIKNLGEDIPWHISKFFPNYNFTNYDSTPLKTLTEALEIGKITGLKYIYLGNVLQNNDTICPNCGKVLIVRIGYSIKSFIVESGKCPNCGVKISGIWK
ncbi:MAG: AmmeMemoRadiSam system radical SAM enzyme [Chitinispirillaceae bacterium]|nr:AmmeMemoRadiSam system radical SAM enzyme [Chitinispirillaceae bacterium]